jgi:hypothetical protein
MKMYKDIDLDMDMDYDMIRGNQDHSHCQDRSHRHGHRGVGWLEWLDQDRIKKAHWIMRRGR